MPSKSVHKIVDHIKFECEDWGGDLQIDEPSLYRHVEQMLDLEQEPPDLAPVEVVEDQVRLISCIKIEVTDLTDNETTTGRRGSRAEIAAAAKWAWVLFHDFFGEYPPTGDEDGYYMLVHRVLGLRRPHVIEQLPPLS